MENLVTIVHVLASIGVIGLVLLQHGKGADMGAAFGSGASGSLFGVSGSSNFLSRATAICVAIFFVTSLTLAYIASNRSASSSVVKAPASTQVAPLPTVAPETAPPADAQTKKNDAVKDIPN